MEQKSIFLEIFGDYPIYRILDFFMVYEDFDYSMKQIAKNSGVGYSTLKLFWNDLVKNDIVEFTRQIGNAKMYKINLGNPIVKKFKAFYWEVTKQRVHEELDKKAVVKVLTKRK